MQESEDLACTCPPSEHDQSYMQAVWEGHVAAADAVDLLSREYFFTSPKLAALATEAEILAKVLPPSCVLHQACHQSTHEDYLVKRAARRCLGSSSSCAVLSDLYSLDSHGCQVWNTHVTHVLIPAHVYGKSYAGAGDGAGRGGGCPRLPVCHLSGCAA